MNKPEPTVYIVDDDEAVRNSLVWLVSSVKMPAIAYGSADELLDSLSPGTTGCILIDVPMAIRAMKTGAVDFIEKPFNDQHVIELISKAMEKSADAYRKADRTEE